MGLLLSISAKIGGILSLPAKIGMSNSLFKSFIFAVLMIIQQK